MNGQLEVKGKGANTLKNCQIFGNRQTDRCLPMQGDRPHLDEDHSTLS